MNMTAQFDVIEDTHMAEELHILERSGNTQLGNFMRLDFGDVLLFEKYFPSFRLVKPIDAIEQAGFTGAVWTDNGKDLPLFNPGGYPGKGVNAPEGQGNIFNNQLIGFWVVLIL
jgi:hypothetical protein